MDRETRNHILWISLLWVVFSALGEWLVQVWIDNWPLIASAEGEIIGEAIFFLLRATTPVFVLVVLIVVYSAVRFRVSQDDDRPAEAQFATGWLFVTGWVGMSVVLNVIFIFYPGIYGLEALWARAQAAAAADPLQIEVTGRQWEWEYHYPDQEIETINDLVVPIDRPVHFTLATEDVIHSFWVPAWGLKKAVMPGETRSMFVTPTAAIGTADAPNMRVQCAQICGAGHSLMRSGVRVVSAAAFADWVAEQKEHGEGMHMEMQGMDMPGGGMEGMDMENGTAHGKEDMDMHDDGAEMPMETDGSMDMESGATEGMEGMEMPAGDAEMPMETHGAMNTDSDATEGMEMPEEGSMTMPPQDGENSAGTTGN